ncbi:MAG: dihydroorotate dehydrogenase B catalytic subunit [Gemmatimonadetes bacterium]|nr:dihydroorotate dehydrogenase B catalytic subunit [Gemmatimonadota bacterium]MDP6982904.1 dihydroorotate dehydrogenase [Candidatus Latescibacterota bacterium]MEC8930106.1 dihydroorotate dehydrogenase [Candidatus Latescibacterota bacterium]MEC8991148.1 dihydroorotate dehydrogenase [Candidatus Latescibacterota bacterium]MED5414347.1 dihydroorotate dehydrogenase [Candidatus Latescibacterota bacterium]
MSDAQQVDLSTRVAGIDLANPVLLASGTCGYGEELEPFLRLAEVGGIITKTITPEPRSGNRPPRIVETPSGMLNAIGLQNPGLEGFVEHKWPFLSTLETKVIVNIAAPTVEQHGEMTARIDALGGVAGIEVNISCPNIREGGVLFGCNPRASADVISTVRRHTKLPVIAKLTPNVTDITEIARSVVDAGADAVSLINTLVGMAVDIEARRPILGNVTGGLSGPAIKPVALAMLWKVRQAVDVPLLGLGGISSTQDALEFLITGASAIQVGTATFVKPGAAADIVAGLGDYCRKAGIARLDDLVGSLKS